MCHSFIFSQRNNGFTNLTGIDYSSGAIQLAKKVAEADGFKDIVFEVGSVTKNKKTIEHTLVKVHNMYGIN